ncbi:MAG: protein kinase [Tepidisphaeraceae bacterium]|jgi:serine/threonine protein kinase
MTHRVCLSPAADSPSARAVELTLTEGKSDAILGRGPRVHCMLEDASVGSQHCRLIQAGHEVHIEQIDSARGTWLNGTALRGAMTVRDCDQLRIGNLMFQLKIDEIAGPADAPDGATVATGTGGAFAERAMAALEKKYPAEVSLRGSRAMQSLIEEGVKLARQMGFATDDHLLGFLECALLQENGLADLNAPNSDLLLTLTTKHPPAARLQMAMRITQRNAARRKSGGSGGSVRQPAAAPDQPRARPDEPRTAPVRRQPASPRLGSFAGVSVTRGTPPPDEDTDVDAADPVSLPRIEGYTVLRKIGEGGMGNVYQAREHQLDREVAIKMLRTMHPSAQEQFLHEAKALARLRHPNIVPILNYGRCGEAGYYVMQMVAGKDAGKLVRLFGAEAAQMKQGVEILNTAGVEMKLMSSELRACAGGNKPYYRLVANWFAGLADGLHCVHDSGVIHRDIKPTNLLLSDDGRMLLVDFGLATLRGERMPGMSACVGTPRYLSPEMVGAWASGTLGPQTDARADIWSLGATFYEFLAFRPAYEGTVAEVMQNICILEPVPPVDLVWQVPKDLQSICLDAMRRDPNDRYQKARHIGAELRRWLAGKPPLGAKQSGLKTDGTTAVT